MSSRHNSAQFEHMKHTSIRLSDEHAAKIAESGMSSSKVIQKALDLYFESLMRILRGFTGQSPRP
jgi:hypothetical protein